MNSVNSHLPSDFGELERFVGDWGPLTTQEARYLKRQTMSIAALRDFYDTMLPRLDDVLEHLDSFPVNGVLASTEETLYRLALGLTEAAAAVEVFGQARVPGAQLHHRVACEWNDGTS